MDIGYSDMTEQTVIWDNDMSVQAEVSDGGVVEQNEYTDNAEGKRKKAPKKDRSNAKYSETDFLGLPRAEQLKLAEKYWNGTVADFDDGTFQFSYTHFGEVCKRIGFRKGIVDTMPERAPVLSGTPQKGSTIYIDHGRRESATKKLTLSNETIEKMDLLLGDKLSNIEKSKVIDAIISQAFDEKLAAQKAGQFGVAYRPMEEERLL